ncbi:NAD-dependent epimerase/dehydratase family protein [Halopenitus salinus]|uniref:NAD-dependent epimerase/dehydratase family protein n=1 Tax=Halopenitus salinus TaxID=1198295 RepID=A0ABD5UT10_9EURY
MTTGETVLVTGGTGFIGAYTAADLLDRGHEVVSFDIRTDSEPLSRLDIADDVHTIRGDITDATAVFRAIEKTDATRIVHLAALLTNRTRDDPRAAIDVNVTGTNTMFEAARTFDRIERVVWASSSAVYAPPEHYEGRQVTEDDLVRPATLYGAAKAYNERQAEVYREDHGVSHVGLRPTLVYGPYRESGSATSFTRVIEGPALGESVEIGPADAVFDWQYATDAAHAFATAAFVPDEVISWPAYNVCGTQATLADVADVVRDLLPDADIEVTAEGECPWTHTMDDSAARADLGYDPDYDDLRKGVKRYVNVLRRDNGLEPV